MNGVDAKEHPVFKELERVRQYFAKVKEAEEKVSAAKPSTTLNKQAAARIIQHSLVREKGKVSVQADGGQAGNGASDMTQREKELRERLLAKRKQKNNASSPLPATITPPAAAAAHVLDSISKEIEMLDQEGSEEGEIGEEPEIDQPPVDTSATLTNGDQSSGKKRRHNDTQSGKVSNGQKSDKKARKKAKKAAKAATTNASTAG